MTVSGGPVDLGGCDLFLDNAGSSITGLTISDGTVSGAASASGDTVNMNGSISATTATGITVNSGGSLSCTTPSGVTLNDGTVSWENGSITGANGANGAVGTASISDTSVSAHLTNGDVSLFSGVSLTGSLGQASLSIGGASNVGSGLVLGGGHVGIGGTGANGISFAPSGSASGVAINSDNVAFDGSNMTIAKGEVSLVGNDDTATNLAFTGGGLVVVGGSDTDVDIVTGAGVGLQIVGTGDTVSDLNLTGLGESILMGGSNNMLQDSQVAGAEVTFSNATGDTLQGNYLHGAIGETPSSWTMAALAARSAVRRRRERNEISCGNGTGIDLGTNVSNTIIENNYIGTNEAGTAAAGMAVPDRELTGILLNGINDTGTMIENNLIAGNTNSGILVGTEPTFRLRGTPSAWVQTTNRWLTAPASRVTTGLSVTIGGTSAMTATSLPATPLTASTWGATAWWRATRSARILPGRPAWATATTAS